MHARSIVIGMLVCASCADDGSPMASATLEGSEGALASSEGSATIDPDDTGTLASTGDTASQSDTDELPSTVLLRTTLTIPLDTVVEEFSLSAPVTAWAGSGQAMVLAVRDLSHPERDQAALCPGSHPLDGCATVDYGAFGSTHDNRLTFDGPRGPWSIHLYKDRSVQLEPEPLPVNE